MPNPPPRRRTVPRIRDGRRPRVAPGKLRTHKRPRGLRIPRCCLPSPGMENRRVTRRHRAKPIPPIVPIGPIGRICPICGSLLIK